MIGWMKYIKYFIGGLFLACASGNAYIMLLTGFEGARMNASLGWLAASILMLIYREG